MNLPALSLSSPKGIATFILAVVAALYVIRRVPQLRDVAGVLSPLAARANTVTP